ncbi:HET domain-containing protein [Microdochium nivale]|nr:HET domain-containing protein [Microdochium nivale]
MRLLRVDTLEPIEFMPDKIPSYAILSHTWEQEEVSYEELVRADKAWQKKAGWSKIVGFARQAAADMHEYIWVDTCCIDKKSSAELQEAINSMFKWYSRAKVCYVYLSDISAPKSQSRTTKRRRLSTPKSLPSHDGSWHKARWWSRGWTLQELLAPLCVEFFDKCWNKIGTKIALLDVIEKITGIRRKFLVLTRSLSQQASVAERMSWMTGRSTTREEDMAYCLLGIFDIHMPMLYGEGRKAFTRLQEEIMKVDSDATLLAWPALRHVASQGTLSSWVPRPDLLADAPEYFAGGRCLRNLTRNDAGHQYTRFFVTQRGLQITLGIVRDNNFKNLVYGVLNCSTETQCVRNVAIPIILHDGIVPQATSNTFEILEGTALVAESLPMTTIPINLSRQLRTICLRLGQPSIPRAWRELDFSMNPQIGLRYPRFVAYPPCALTPVKLYTSPNPASIDQQSDYRLLVWLQDEKSHEGSILIRLEHQLGEQEPEDFSWNWHWQAVVYKDTPTTEFLIGNIADDHFWQGAEPANIHRLDGSVLSDSDVFVWWLEKALQPRERPRISRRTGRHRTGDTTAALPQESKA